MIGYLSFPFSRWQLHFIYGENGELTDRQSKYKILTGQTGKGHVSVSAPQTVTSQINQEGGQGGKGEGYNVKGLMPLSAADFSSEAHTPAIDNFLYGPPFLLPLFST